MLKLKELTETDSLCISSVIQVGIWCQNMLDYVGNCTNIILVSEVGYEGNCNNIILCYPCCFFRTLYPSNNYAFRLFNMKVMLDVFSLCESAADLVGPTLEIFKERRRKGHFKSLAKANSIVDAIMAKPKKFLNLSIENLLILSGLDQNEFRNQVLVAVKVLGKPKYKNMIQVLIFDSDDERVLRGD